MLLRRRCCCTVQLRDLIQTKGTRKIGDRLVWSIFPFLFFPFFLFSGPRAVEFSWVRSVSSHIVYTYIYINIELKKEKRRIERESENEGKFSRPSSMDWVPECRPSLARAPRTTFSLSKKIFPKKSLPDKFSVLRPFFFSLFRSDSSRMLSLSLPNPPHSSLFVHLSCLTRRDFPPYDVRSIGIQSTYGQLLADG